MQNNTDNSFIANFILVLFLAAFPVILLKTNGTEDLWTFTNWMMNVLQVSIQEGYALNKGDYPPLYIYTLLPFTFLLDEATRPLVTLCIKLAIFCFFYLSAIVFYRITRDKFLTLLWYFTFALHALFLKYIDINYAPFLLVGLWALKNKHYTIFALCYTVCCLIKWPPLIIGPFLALYIFHQSKLETGRFLSPVSIKPALASFALIGLCFFWFGSAITDALNKAMNEPYLSGRALNAQWIVTYFLQLNYPDLYRPLDPGGLAEFIVPGKQIITWAKIPFSLFFIATLVAFWRSEKTFTDLLFFCVIGFFTYFTLNTGVHENHLFLPIAIALFLCSIEKRFMSIAILLIVIMNFNLLVFYGVGIKTISAYRDIGMDITVLLSVAVTLLWANWWYRYVWKNLISR